jgi:hypothetical protein
MNLVDHANRQSGAAGITRDFDAPSYRSMIPITELEKRPSRAPDHAAECVALLALGEELAASPDRILQKLAESTLTLCDAQSAGLSLLEPDGERFYWPAIAGEWADKVGAAHRAIIARVAWYWIIISRFYVRIPRLISITIRR